MRPSRRWVHVALAAALVLVATWGLSRTLGSSTQTGGGGDQAPAGEHHQHADEAAAAGHDHGESTVPMLKWMNIPNRQSTNAFCCR